MIPSHWRDILLLVAYCGLIFWLSDQPALPVPSLLPHQDKFAHAALFALLGWLSWQAFGHWLREEIPLFLASLAFSALYGLSDEWHQSFVPGRTMDLLDWLADLAGILMMLLWIRWKNAAVSE
jgi:VanZ family protein